MVVHSMLDKAWRNSETSCKVAGVWWGSVSLVILLVIVHVVQQICFEVHTTFNLLLKQCLLNLCCCGDFLVFITSTYSQIKRTYMLIAQYVGTLLP